MKLTFALIFQTATAHMAMTLPAPRRSPQHPAYRGSGADYDITAPLGGSAKFPCRGAPAGPIFKSYQAGSDIDVRIGGSAVHGGGHCQFSMTYDSVNFAVLKTVMGNCLTASRDYKVSIPKDAPNGNVTFAWTWFNKVGNREIYMNCADITITGGSNSGTITGKKMVVANWPGYPTFPEKFANDYGKALYENQPLITIRNTKSIVPKAAPLAKKVPFISKPLAKNISSKRCIQGKWYCKGLNKIGLCQNNAISYQNCYRGTICQSNGQASYCQKSS